MFHKLWRCKDPQNFHLEYGYSCMGYEIAGGLGVKMADDTREVYVPRAAPAGLNAACVPWSSVLFSLVQCHAQGRHLQRRQVDSRSRATRPGVPGSSTSVPPHFLRCGARWSAPVHCPDRCQTCAKSASAPTRIHLP